MKPAPLCVHRPVPRLRESASKLRIGSFGLVILGICLNLSLTPVAAAQSFVLYGATDTGAIYEVNPVAQTSTQVANFGSYINGLTWVEEQQRLYFTDHDPAGTGQPGDGGLYYWDRTTGTFSSQLLAPADLPGHNDNGSYYNGAIWYADGNGLSNTMWRVDVNTLAISEFANFNGTARTYFDFGDLVVDSSGLVHGFASNETASSTFFTVDISSGTPVNYSEYSTDFLYQLGIDPHTDTLYATAGANGGMGTWFTVDGSTGATTAIPGFVTEKFTDLSGMAATPVPEPGGALLIGTFGVCLLMRRRRRRQA